MQRIKLAFGLSCLLLTIAWLGADTLMPEPFTYFSFRTVFVQYSGVLAIALMSLAMLLAARPQWIERPLQGLDKMYRLHKWLGIGALVTSVLHWWFAKGTKWMVGWGWLERPQRHARGAAETLSGMEAWLRTQRGLAESLGEWAFYIAAALLLIALIKWFPYRLFRKLHKWLAAVYLVLAWHSLVLLKFDYWTQPIGWIMAALMAAGTVSAVLVLLGRVGQRRKVQGVIESLDLHPEMQVIEGRIRIDQDWPGHQAGQFAFLTSNPREGAHPYTIASAWQAGDHQLSFVVKQLGDWTARLHEWLQVGMPVTVEGPYGHFDFNDRCARQIWIGAGIGITPFMAGLKQRPGQGDPRPIDLFYVTSCREPVIEAQLQADAAAARVKLHIIFSPQDGRLTPERIRQLVPEWQQASFWFCGPTAFGTRLRSAFVRQGLPGKRFHQELFEMR